MKARILIVDDNPDNIQVISTVLANDGYDIEFSLNGVDAIEWVSQSHFDLILLDVSMPEMDGFEVCQKIISLPNKNSIPIIFLTAKTDLESISTGFDSGGVDYITKPFFEKELLARVATHLKIQSQNKELQLQNSFKNILMSVIAHDIRTPLSIISNMVNVVKRKIEKENKEKDEFGESLAIIDTSINESFNIVNDLLVWGKVQFGKININFTEFNLAELIDEITEVMSSFSDEKKISILNNVQKELLIFSDRELIKVVLRNLLINSLKFTPAMGEISVSYTLLENNLFSICVSDSGIGLNKNKLQGIFSSNIKTPSTDSFRENGMGLGLFLCKGIVEFLNGKISVESIEGKGSSFRIELPQNKIEN